MTVCKHGHERGRYQDDLECYECIRENAMLKERDRCAKIAATRGEAPRYGKYEEDAESSAYQDGVQVAAEEIEAEIRSGK